MRRLWSLLWSVLGLALAALLAGPILLEDSPWPTLTRDLTEGRAVSETGALNLVSSLYLGYRAYDTLGETIVLLLGVLGTLGLVHAASRPSPSEGPRKLRTEFLDVASGKLGPIVLVFGFYVMFYGHVSPGGGFQGGVVLASGLVFLALGSREAVFSPLVRAAFLKNLEATAFLLIVSSALAGLLLGLGFFADVGRVWGLPSVSFIVALNVSIGLKVGSSLGLLCLVLLERVR